MIVFYCNKGNYISSSLNFWQIIPLTVMNSVDWFFKGKQQKKYKIRTFTEMEYQIDWLTWLFFTKETFILYLEPPTKITLFQI